MYLKHVQAYSSDKSSFTLDAARKDLTAGASPAKQKSQTIESSSLTWTEKYRPKVPNDIIGNQSLVSQSLVFPFAIVTYYLFSFCVCKSNINVFATKICCILQL